MRRWQNAYLSGDVYHALALLCGLTNDMTSNAGRMITPVSASE